MVKLCHSQSFRIRWDIDVLEGDGGHLERDGHGERGPVVDGLRDGDDATNGVDGFGLTSVLGQPRLVVEYCESISVN